MRIITISREFGSGGRELGKRLADILNCDYYDNEIISAVAKNSGLDEKYVENQLNNHGWQNFPITFRSTLGMNTYVNYGNGELLLEQKKVIQDIAKLNKDCVIVGRNADVILKEYNPFNLFICANMESKIKRCKERSKDGENLTDKELVKKIKAIDKIRCETRDILTGTEWGKRNDYHLIINTTDWDIKELSEAVAEFATCWFERQYYDF